MRFSNSVRKKAKLNQFNTSLIFSLKKGKSYSKSAIGFVTFRTGVRSRFFFAKTRKLKNSYQNSIFIVDFILIFFSEAHLKFFLILNRRPVSTNLRTRYENETNFLLRFANTNRVRTLIECQL